MYCNLARKRKRKSLQSRSTAPVTFYSITRYVRLMKYCHMAGSLILRISSFLSHYHFDEIANNCLAFRGYNALWMKLNPLVIPVIKVSDHLQLEWAGKNYIWKSNTIYIYFVTRWHTTNVAQILSCRTTMVDIHCIFSIRCLLYQPDKQVGVSEALHVAWRNSAPMQYTNGTEARVPKFHFKNLKKGE